MLRALDKLVNREERRETLKLLCGLAFDAGRARFARAELSCAGVGATPTLVCTWR